jgi:hypothetical protein
MDGVQDDEVGVAACGADHNQYGVFGVDVHAVECVYHGMM